VRDLLERPIDYLNQNGVDAQFFDRTQKATGGVYVPVSQGLLNDYC